LVLSALLWSLVGCGQGEGEETAWTAAQMAESLYALDAAASFERITAGEAGFADYLTNYYHIDPQDVADGAILYTGGASAQEIAVLRLESAALAEDAEEALRSYIEERTGAFTGYLPEEAAMLEQSSAVRRGSYAALLICEGQRAAQELFDSCFAGAEPPAVSPLPPGGTEAVTPSANPAPEAEAGTEGSDSTEESAESGAAESTEASGSTEPGTAESAALAADNTEPPSAPTVETEPVTEPVTETEAATEAVTEPEGPWHYDRRRLVAAWNAGDWSGLHSRDREILDKCSGVIASRLSGEMTAYDKELAVHDWMIEWGSYDSDTLSHQQNAEPNPDHDNPYGFLIGKKGICLGYTSTFQLFMDLLGIECITVHGTAYSKTEEHAWNMVKLEGEWYCVDVTWDDPTTYSSVSALTAHRYFNVTSEFLRGRDHQWDESTVSEATATTYAWNPYA